MCDRNESRGFFNPEWKKNQSKKELRKLLKLMLKIDLWWRHEKNKLTKMLLRRFRVLPFHVQMVLRNGMSGESCAPTVHRFQNLS